MSYLFLKGKRIRKMEKSRRCEFSGKVRYQSHTQALMAGSRVLKPGEAMRAYQCPRCRSYHLTSQV